MSKVLPDETVQLGICLFGDNDICFVQDMCENTVLYRLIFQTKKKTPFFFAINRNDDNNRKFDYYNTNKVREN